MLQKTCIHTQNRKSVAISYIQHCAKVTQTTSTNFPAFWGTFCSSAPKLQTIFFCGRWWKANSRKEVCSSQKFLAQNFERKFALLITVKCSPCIVVMPQWMFDCWCDTNGQGPVVQRADNAIQRINSYPVDKW